jgi:hypothetical protein
MGGRGGSVAISGAGPCLGNQVALTQPSAVCRQGWSGFSNVRGSAGAIFQPSTTQMVATTARRATDRMANKKHEEAREGSDAVHRLGVGCHRLIAIGEPHGGQSLSAKNSPETATPKALPERALRNVTQRRRSPVSRTGRCVLGTRLGKSCCQNASSARHRDFLQRLRISV